MNRYLTLPFLGLAALGTGILAMILYRKHNVNSWGEHDQNDEIDIEGKVVIITGASSGLGKETAYQLVKRGATVLIPCRDETTALSALQEIQKRKNASKGKLIPMVMDLASLASVREFVEDFKRSYDRVDLLILNAGVSYPYRKDHVTQDGFEIHFGINHLAHFLLTDLLIEYCKRAAPSRIVTVSSLYHQTGVLRMDDLNLKNLTPEQEKEVKPYHDSKLANVFFSQELAYRLRGTDVHTYCVCPGWCYTGLGRHAGLKWYHYIVFAPIAFLFMRSSEQGCQTILHCALSHNCSRESGKFYRNCEHFVSSVPLVDSKAKLLWEKSAEMVGVSSKKYS